MTEAQSGKAASTHRPGVTVMAIVAVVVLFAGVYLTWRHYQAPPRSIYLPVLEAIKAHQIATDDSGRADLSRQFPDITGHNDAYITYREDGSFVVMFPTWYGQGQQVSGLVYTSRPLTDLDTHNRTSAINFDHKLIEAGSYAHLLLDKKIDANWYQVSYKVR